MGRKEKKGGRDGGRITIKLREVRTVLVEIASASLHTVA